MATDPIAAAGAILGILGASFHISKNLQTIHEHYAAAERQISSFRAEIEQFRITWELMDEVINRWGRRHFSRDLTWRLGGIRDDSAEQLDGIRTHLVTFLRTDGEAFRRDRRRRTPIALITLDDIAIRNQVERRIQLFTGDAMRRGLFSLRVYKQTLTLLLAIVRFVTSYGIRRLNCG
jgi:hypothetical protein